MCVNARRAQTWRRCALSASVEERREERRGRGDAQIKSGWYDANLSCNLTACGS